MNRTDSEAFKYLLCDRGTARPPVYPTGSLAKDMSSTIDIFHPQYPDYGPMLKILASDVGGVFYDVLYYSCCVVAGNCWVEDDGPSTTMLKPLSTLAEPSSNESSTSTTPHNETRSTRSQGKRPAVQKEQSAAEGSQQAAGSSRTSVTDPSIHPYLSATRRKPKPILLPEDGIIRHRQLYFIVPKYQNKNEAYPLYPNFFHWKFPHGNVPRLWLDLPDNVLMEHAKPIGSGQTTNSSRHTEPCRLTGDNCLLDSGHIIPRTCTEWTTLSHMSQYGTGLNQEFDDADSFHNTVPVAKNIHTGFDRGVYVPFPKRMVDRKRPELFCHLLTSPGNGIDCALNAILNFHNRRYERFYGVPREYLFARFAWTLFQQYVFPIIHQEKSLRLLVRTRIEDPYVPNRFDPDDWEDDIIKPQRSDFVFPRKGHALKENAPGGSADAPGEKKSSGKSKTRENDGQPQTRAPPNDEGHISDDSLVSHQDDSLEESMDSSSSSGSDLSDSDDGFERMTSDRYFLDTGSDSSTSDSSNKLRRKAKRKYPEYQVARGRSPTKRRRSNHNLSSDHHVAMLSPSESFQTTASSDANSSESSQTTASNGADSGISGLRDDFKTMTLVAHQIRKDSSDTMPLVATADCKAGSDTLPSLASEAQIVRYDQQPRGK